jgi:hypothetical protein
MTKKSIIGIISAVLVACVITAVVLIFCHHRVDFPKSSWASVGHADAPSALATVLDAASRGDGQKILDSISPALQQKFQKDFGAQMQQQGVSMADLISQVGAQFTAGITGFHIVSQRVVSDDRITLRVQLQGRPQGVSTFKMKKIGGEWKLDDFS